MFVIKVLIIFGAFHCAFAQRYDVCGDDSGLRYVHIPKMGWVGLGWANTQDKGQFRNIEMILEYETSVRPDPNNLGSLKILTMIPLTDPENSYYFNIPYEFTLPTQYPLPEVTKVTLEEAVLCNITVSMPYVVQLRLSYNHYTQTNTLKAEIIKTPESTTTLAPRDDRYEDDSETVGCGKVDTVNIYVPLILEGKTIERGQWPWLVSVYSYSNLRLGFRCGATLISNKLVVTAAHCFFDVYNRRVKSDDVLIILGQYNLKRPQDQGTKIVYPQSVNIHPDYQKLTKIDSDIAVVVIPDRVQFTHYIRPACLWKGPDSKENIVGRRGLTAGWGRDENGYYFTELPKQTEIPVVSDEECLRSNDVFTRITSDVTFCAGWRNGTEGPCNGDSGGPLVFDRDGRWTLRGVVSTSLLTDGSNTCNLNEYVVFTDVVPFTDWILSFDKEYEY